MAGKRPVAAILYDFDRTLCTKDMQEYQFIPSVGMEPADFWGLANSYAEEEHMDKILSYMYIMIKKSQECGIPLTRKSVMECGRAIELLRIFLPPRLKALMVKETVAPSSYSRSTT